MFRAYAALVLIGFIWGSNFVYMKIVTAVVDPLQVVLLRVLAGFVPLALVAWKKGVIHRGQLRHLPHFAVMSVMATSFYYYGFVAGAAPLPSSVAGLLGGAIPIVTFLTSLVFLRGERPNRFMAAGVAVGFAGIVLTARPWEGGVTIDPLGVLGTGLAYLIYYYILQQLGAVGASGATYLPAVVAVLIGAAVGETVSATEIAALGLILGGVALIQFGTRRQVV